jgi:NAD(P)-dependent dehydrogenase (short-subunit alcohol dehydrogenase family)
MTARLSGEVAIVTGSTSGLGKAIAVAFAAEGAAVVVTGRDEPRGEAVVAAIRAATGPAGAPASEGRAIFVAGDLADPSTPDRLVTAAAEAFGSPTVLVNNAVAGGSPGGDGPVTEIDPGRWEQVIRVDLSAAAWMCRAVIPAMQAAGHGSIVNISSRASERGTPRVAAYSASKGGLNALTRAIAVDYGREGIRCNTLSPGYVLHEVRDRDMTTDRRARLEGMQLTRLAGPADIAWAAVYLASRESEVVTGINLAVDGGSTTARALVLG